MIGAILGKTLGDRRRSVLGYSLGVVALAVWLGALYPVLRDSEGFTRFMNNLPSGMMSAFGIEPDTFLTAAGFVGSYLYSLFAPLLVLLFVISAMVAEMPSEERDGLMDMLLSSPVSRIRVFGEKVGGVAILSLALTAVLSAALLGVNPIFDLSLSVTGILAAGLSLWLLGMLFGAITLMAGAISGRSVVAGGVAGGLALASWFVHGFADFSPALQGIKPASPFTWYQEPPPLTTGVGGGHLWLATAAGALIVVAALLFGRRDIASELALPRLKLTQRARVRRRRSLRTAWLLTGGFGKTLWDRRRSVWGFGGGLGLLTLLMFSAWPALARDAEALAGLITSLPREVFAMFGMSDPQAIVTPAGFISSRTYQAIGPIIIVMFVVRGVSMAMVAEENDGTLDLVLTTPVTHAKMMAGKALGVVASTGLVVVILTGAALWADAAWETGLGVGNVLAAGAGLGLLGLFFGGLTMALWAGRGSSFPAVRITAVAALATFLLNGLGSLSDALAPVRWISPFYWYFGDAPPLAKGLHPTYFLLLVGALAMGGLAVTLIKRRDIAT